MKIIPHHWFLLSCLFCALLASLAFMPGQHGGFVFDDAANIVDNPAIHLDALDAGSLYDAAFGRQPGGITRVIPSFTFALDYWRGGGANPSVFKATNIAIHALTTFVLACFFRTLLLTAKVSDRRAALAAPLLALAWAVHPLQVSAVLYVVQRMQTLCTLFVVLALYAYLRARNAQIAGNPGRTGWLLAGLAWVTALACKEDAALLPAYMLALELTVLGFRAHSPVLARRLRTGYLVATIAAAVLFLSVVVPHFWHWNNYPERDYTSYERLLTQGRVLCMYLWEILIPLPQHMPFYYDWIQPSRSLLHPWTTLPSILLVLALFAAAWRLRNSRPLFALGVLLFFAGHLITSNVVGLELAFEHRNHFPLIGMVLAIAALASMAMQKLHLRPIIGVICVVVPLVLMAGATVTRARTWGNPLTLARASTMYAPHSARAWNSMCLYYYELGGGKNPGNPYLGKAVDICGKGAAAAPYSVTSLVNVIVFKTKLGTITQRDWDELQERLLRVNMGPENMRTTIVLMYNVNSGVPLDENNTLKSIDIISNRISLGSNELASIGYFILTQTHQPDRAYAYFERSVKMASHGALSSEIIDEIKARGKADWIEKLAALNNTTANSPQHSR